MAAAKNKSILILLVFIFAGLVIGGLLGEFAKQVDFLWWFGYEKSFGLTSPIELNLSVVQISFSILFKINIASIIGMGIGIFIYRKI